MNAKRLRRGAVLIILVAGACSWSAEPTTEPEPNLRGHRDAVWVAGAVPTVTKPWVHGMPARATFTVVNELSRPVTAEVTCVASDANGDFLRRTQAHGIGVPPRGRIGGLAFFHSVSYVPATANCHVSDWAPIRSTQPILRESRANQEQWQPARISFWTPGRGLMVGSFGRRTVVKRTLDGGRTWRNVLEVKGTPASLAAVGTDRAWMSTACWGRPCRVLASSDGGSTWRRLPAPFTIESMSFVSRATGYAVSAEAEGGAGEVIATADGGRSWESLGNPCPRKGSFPAYRLAAVSFVNRGHGWAACQSEPGAGDFTFKVILETLDGGQTWRVAGGSTLDGPVKSRMPYANGDFSEIEFRADGTGWAGMNMADLFVTRDGGRRWRPVILGEGSLVLNGSAFSVSFPSEGVGFALEYLGGRGHLWRTTTEGRRWVSLRAYRY